MISSGHALKKDKKIRVVLIVVKISAQTVEGNCSKIGSENDHVNQVT